METDIICINNTFNQECLELYAKYGVKIPKKGKIYSIRTKQRHSHGEWGIKLNEIHNPDIPNGYYDNIFQEPSWHVSRFTDLLGNPLLQEKELKEVENTSILKEIYNQFLN